MAAIELNVTSIGRINSISDTSLNNTYAVVYNSSTGTPMGFEMDIIVDMDASLVAAHADIASVELGLSNEVTARGDADNALDEKIKNVTTGHDHDGVDSRVVDHDNLANKGTNTHAQIDAHIANTANPHSITKAQVGLGNADNTSDADKPISIAQGSALAVLFKAISYNETTGVLTLTKRDDSTVTVTIPAIDTVNSKAPLASPALTGTPTTPTAAPGTNTTQIASTAFVAAAIAALVDSSPATLDTLNELAAALGDDPNFATTVTNLIGQKINISDIANDLITETEGKVLDARQGKELDDKKVDKVTGKGLSANDYTTEEKAEVAKIATIESDLNDTTELTTAEAIAKLAKEIDGIKTLLAKLTTGEAWIDKLLVMSEFNLFGETNMIIKATTAPVPDFIGQIFINTTSAPYPGYIAIGTSSVSDWKQITN